MEKNPEQIMDKLLLKDDSRRQIINDVGDSGWGQLIFPGASENPNKSGNGLRIVLFASYLHGYQLSEVIKKMEIENPGKINYVGLVTDDPASPTAKISVRRRIWRLFDEKQTINLESAMVESALSFGVPVYTGAVKTDYFRELLAEWAPDVIMVSVFGQIIDQPIIDAPPYGIYNFHPADLGAHHGAGPQPFQDLIDRDAKTSRVTVHQLTVDLDSGPILGTSPEVNVRFADGNITNNILVIDDKMMEPMDTMAAMLTKTLALKKEEGLKGKVDKLDFSKHFSEEMRQKLMEAVISKEPSKHLPQPAEAIDYSI